MFHNSFYFLIKKPISKINMYLLKNFIIIVKYIISEIDQVLFKFILKKNYWENETYVFFLIISIENIFFLYTKSIWYK